jgi:hypothetical protein
MVENFFIHSLSPPITQVGAGNSPEIPPSPQVINSKKRLTHTAPNTRVHTFANFVGGHFYSHA